VSRVYDLLFLLLGFALGQISTHWDVISIWLKK